MQVESQFIPSKGHPLQTNWKFWYVQRYHHFPLTDPTTTAEGNLSQLEAPKQKPVKITDYRERLKDMGQISTIEQFFQSYVYMKKPSEMPREIDLFFFRENEIPMWEVSSLS